MHIYVWWLVTFLRLFNGNLSVHLLRFYTNSNYWKAVNIFLTVAAFMKINESQFRLSYCSQ